MSTSACGSPTLPVEILDLIVKEVEHVDFKGLPSLRLVCKAINELAGPIVFHTLTISMMKSTMTRIQSQLPTLAGSVSDNPSVNARWTKELHISNLVPVTPITRPDPHRLPSDFLGKEEEEVIRNVQSTCLAPAIQSLNNVESVYFGISAKEPHSDVFQSLAQLSNLQELHLTLSGRLYVDEQLPIDIFPSNLRILELWAPGSESRPLLKNFDLDLLPGVAGQRPQIGHSVDHGIPPPRIFEDTLNQASPFAPTLRRLTVTYLGLIFRSASVPYLRNLTHLSILGDHEGLPSFWEALSQAGVRLRHLTSSPSRGLAALNYLTTYNGLEELHLTGGIGDITPDIPRKCFHEVLPYHQKSLQHLSFESLPFELWSITEEYLEGVLQCTSLRTLALLILINPRTGSNSVDLSILLIRIAEHLPNLQTLRLQPERHQPRRPRGLHIFPRPKNAADSFLKSIREIDLGGVAFAKEPGFLVEVVWQLIMGKSVLGFDSSRRRFEPIAVEPVESDSDTEEEDE